MQLNKSDPIDGTIEIAPYDTAWTVQYQQLEECIRNALGGTILLLEHVGSTSVPGLAAKPVIDLVMAVPDSTDEPAYVPALERLGFVLTIREPDWFEHRLLKTPISEGNLHVFSSGCGEIERMLVFRDRLRANQADRRFYEAAKRRLAGRTWKYVQDYADAKSAVVNEILSRATGT